MHSNKTDKALALMEFINLEGGGRQGINRWPQKVSTSGKDCVEN